jgi:hypothetical protein
MVIPCACGLFLYTLSDEGMAPMDTPMKVKDMVSSFLCLYNDKTKNLLLPNIGISNVLRNDGDDDRVWICHEQDRSWCASSQSPIFGSSVARQCFIAKVITRPSGVRMRSMST